MPRKQAKERNRVVLRIASLLSILNKTIETSHLVQTPWSQRAPTNCGSLHYSTSFDKVFDCESQKKILENSNRCFNCLGKGHNDSQCMREKNCRHCKKRHHQSICDQVHAKVNVSITDKTASSKTSSTTTTMTTTTINANVQQSKNCAFTNSKSYGTQRNRHNLDSRQDSV